MSDAWVKPDPKAKRNLDWQTRTEAPDPDFSAFAAAASPSATRPSGRTDGMQQEESLRTPKPGADESDGSAPPSTEKQTSAAAFLAPYNPPPLPPLPPLPLPPVGGTMAPAAPPTTLVAAVGAEMRAPRPDHALLGLAPLAPEGEPINPIAHMIAKGGAHEHPIPVDDCRWAKAGESVILMITTDFAFTPDALITSIRAAIIKLKGDPNMMLAEINYIGRQKALFAATALVANLILRDGEIPVFKTEANDDTVGTGEVKLMRPDGAPYPDTEERLVRQELYAERKGRTSILYVQFPRPYLTFDPQRRLITINQTTEYITKFFTSPEYLVLNGGTLAEDVAAVPLFTALGYPEPQLRFHIRRPPSFPAPEVFFAQFNLAALKFFDIGCHGEACKTRIPRYLTTAIGITPCCFRLPLICRTNSYGQCGAHKAFLVNTKKTKQLKRHLTEPGAAAKDAERRISTRVGAPDACAAWLLGRCYMPNCTDLHPDSEITTASIKCCSLYKPGEQGYNKKRVKCTYAMNKQECPYLHEVQEEQEDAPMI